MLGFSGLWKPGFKNRLVPTSGTAARPNGELDCGASADWMEAPLQPAISKAAATNAKRRIISRNLRCAGRQNMTPFMLPAVGQRAVKFARLRTIPIPRRRRRAVLFHMMAPLRDH